MQLFNLHTHSNFSDGKSEPEEIITEAIHQKLTTIGFSDHLTVPFQNNWAIKQERLTEYVNTIKSLKIKYQNIIDIYCSMEMDYIPEVIKDFANIKKSLGLDYIIGSIHYIGNNIDKLWSIDDSKYEYDKGLFNYFDGNIKKGVMSFFDQYNQMIETEEFDIVGHLDRINTHNHDRYFHEDEKWYRDLILETLKLIKEKGRIVEINTRGIYEKEYNDFYPATWLLPIMHEMNIPIVISSDSHHYSEITMYFDKAEKALKTAGYKEVMSFKNGVWNSVEF